MFIYPERPGVYLMKDKDGGIIYIGKAKDLKKRVSSYFNKNDHTEKTQELISHIKDIDFITTDNEVEAFILESQLIRQHRPRFNIQLKDSVRYAYIRITDERFPRAYTTRLRTKKGKIYGPFVSSEKRRTLLELSQRVFRLRSCQKMPKNVCLLYHIKRCSGPCAGHISREDYMESLRRFEMVLEGKKDDLEGQLEAEMKELSTSLNFEKAKEVKEQLEILRDLERQKVDTQKDYDQDIISMARQDGLCIITLFSVRKGVLIGKKEFRLKEEDELMSSFIRTYYMAKRIPHEIITDERLDDRKALEEFLSLARKSRVRITVPQKGEKKRLLEMVRTNARLSMEKDDVESLRLALRLINRPQVMECFDISTLQGTDNVGACVQFVEGRPNKDEYRRFMIKSTAGQDDFAGIAEIVRRRYTRLLKEGRRLPDLVVIDGGKGQLRAAYSELERLQLDIPLIALAKKEEEIYTIGRPVPIRLDANSPALKLLQRIRDETHRFAITYQKKRREKSL